MVGVLKRAAVLRIIAGLAAPVALLQPQCAAAQGADVRALVDAYNTSGQQLFKRFAPSHGNVVFSPYSIGTAMAMALSGARGENAAQMAKVLHQTLPRPAMDAANASVLATLNGYDRSAETPACPEMMQWSGQQCESAATADGRCPFAARRENDRCIADPTRRPPSAQLRVADALMQAKAGGLVAQEYSALLKDKYGADVLQGVSLGDVNDWVKRKTAGKIDHIIDQLPDVVLLNAVYFKARWELTFGKDLTEQKPFNITRAQKVPVPTMQRTGRFSVVTRNDYRAIRIPYDVSELGMIIVLPKKIDGVGRIGAEMTAQELSKLGAALRADQGKLVELEMPRFKINYEIGNLVSLFKQAGMTRAFDRRQADFSGITGRPAKDLPFWIDDIRHRAFIEVMEDGTEAAAVTAISMRAASARPQPEPKPEPFHIDHPFLFYIVDNATGALLFQGRVANPQ